jgi:peptidoglycan/xylan/chitin deacetylase (PgdA/CDA1 family)
MPVAYLMYHELERQGRPLCDTAAGYRRYVLGERTFEDQLDRLGALGLDGLSVSDALATPDAAAVALTFDDGCETDLLIAAPALRARGLRATFYITSGFVGRRGYLTPAQIGELAAAGFEIGCHGATHRFLTDLPPDALMRELIEPKARIEDLLGAPVVHLSCPGGRWDARVAEAARRAGYQTVATSRPGTNGAGADRVCLARTAITPGMTLAQFERVCRGRGGRLRSVRASVLAGAKHSLGNRAYDRVRALLLGDG